MKQATTFSIPKIIAIALVWAAGLLGGRLAAQNPDIISGYYITPQGDSLAGQLHIGDLRKNILRFRAAGKKGWKNLRPQDIQRAGGDGGLYIVSQEVRYSEEPEQVFVQKKVGGGYSLYEGATSKWGEVFYLASKGNPNLIKVNKLGFEPQLKVLLGDCAHRAKAKNLRYSSAGLTRYIKEVNQCAYPDEKPFAFSQPVKTRFGIGVSTFYYTTPTFKVGGRGGYFAGRYHGVQRVSGGVSARLNISSALNVYAAFNYVDKRIGTDTMGMYLRYVKDEPGIPPASAINFYRYALDLNFKYLDIPLGLTYSLFPYARWSPTVTFGFALQVPLVAKVESDWGYPICPDAFSCTLPPGEVGYLSPTWVKLDKGRLINFFGGLGLKHALKDRNEVEFRAEYYNQSEQAEVGINKTPLDNNTAYTVAYRMQLSLNYHYFFKRKS